ncbi:MAG: DoxX family protein [Chitinophagaceae bacterium]
MSRFSGPSLPIAILRMLLGIVFILHGAARIYENSFTGFGAFLESKGFPLGFYLAWAITLFEIGGGIAFFLRWFVTVFCIGEIVILLAGIVLVHWQNGWFVVGMTEGGIEYSVVLITVLAAIGIAERKSR